MRRPTTHTLVLAGLSGLICVVSIVLLSTGAWYIFSLHTAVESQWKKAIKNQVQAITLQQQASLAVRTTQLRAELVRRSIPSGGTAAYLSQLEALGDSVGADTSVTALTVASPTKGKPGSIQLSLAIEGSYDACIRFVQLLESDGVAQAVSTVSLSRQNSGDRWGGTLAVSAVSFDKP